MENHQPIPASADFADDPTTFLYGRFIESSAGMLPELWTLGALMDWFLVVFDDQRLACFATRL